MNENHNRMIRRFLPKGTTKTTKAIVAFIEKWMNHSTKNVDYKTPEQMRATGQLILDMCHYNSISNVMCFFTEKCYNNNIMAIQSINTRADLATNAISYLGLSKYGKMMVGDKGIEFFSDREVSDNMVFPWNSIRAIQGKVTLSKKIGRNFYIVLQNGHKVRFNSKESGKVLKLARGQLGNDKIVRTQTFIGTIIGVFRRKKND